MKPILLTLLLATLPLFFAFYLNAAAPHPPTKTYRATRCTRYCAAHGCRHATRANSPAYFVLRPLYVATIAGLAAGGMGLYAAVNIAFYLVLIPTLLVWLTYGALRNAHTIRQLKQL
ncbi:hypothetical protein QMK33_22160 [Hymenobacter sp. H14-R3]|uniref:hypothetical protein n=1 Tax=Hymenobacter sp. H14-R3 TaxID=3046308 RepID=UPI0024B9670E|nr:hypothetical protein [Hymenobacter sp. H14-R3]MDJ0367858.1 hypothetical protein [Hymenobacter sp. H14-R3]